MHHLKMVTVLVCPVIFISHNFVMRSWGTCMIFVFNFIYNIVHIVERDGCLGKVEVWKMVGGTKI